MPSPRHDALNRLMQHHPDLPIRLLREVGGIDLPDLLLHVGPGDLRDRISREMHADTVVFGGPRQDRWFSVIVEVETEMSEKKPHDTVVAAAVLWLETRAPVHVIFITPDPDAAKFAGPVQISIGCLTITMHPVIVGPDHIPVLTDPNQMAGDLLTSALSVMAHGHRPDVARAFVKLLGDLPADDATSLFNYTIDMAPPPTRRLLEETVTTYVTENSPWAQNLYRKGQADAVLSVLRLRNIAVPPDRQQQLSTCTDPTLLDLWLQRALDATHIDDLFDDTPKPQPQP
ncbi:hypothetical protein AB0K60_13045 [Thermopolyspora sp. NPDC052614]|uniref:hypothetical protein n=1 Tax=Thermopolyspora sp. NPDC052614 TaxID=3155682 RepID=UPI0034236CDE